MIDLHNHILPGLDDGAADVAESLEIARQCVAEGVTVVAATPHLNPVAESSVDCDMVGHALKLVRDAISREGIELEVVGGHELYLVPEAVPLLEQSRVCTLGESRTLLVELPFEIRPLYMDELMFQIQVAGFHLILAHPERYRFVQRDPSSIEPLVDRGVALQVTAPALLGEYGPSVRKTAETLVQHGLCALAASDRHHPGPLRSLTLMHERIVALTDQDLADLLLRDNPRRVLSGEPVVPPERTWTTAKKSFFDRFRQKRS